uniref:Gag-Pol polyprotein n=1 Tax=Lygus hesperus TaxID=30085 RepID=A0A0A9Z3H5_LYGHE
MSHLSNIRSEMDPLDTPQSRMQTASSARWGSDWASPREFSRHSSFPETSVCRKPGHLTENCWYGKPKPSASVKTSATQSFGSRSTSTPGSSANQRDRQGEQKKCYVCGDTSHYAKNCPDSKAGTSSGPRGKATRFVNLCERNPSGSLVHKGTDA